MRVERAVCGLLAIGLGVGLWLLYGGAGAAPQAAEVPSTGLPQNPLRNGEHAPPADGPTKALVKAADSGHDSTNKPATGGTAPEVVGSLASPIVPTTGDAPTVEAAVGQHPLDACLAVAKKVLTHLRKDVKDYTCVVVKQERIAGTLNQPVYMACKIRQQPFSVYMKFVKPDDVKDREVLYVTSANDGNLLAREGSGIKRAFGMVSLKPTGLLAMEGQRYPITELGLNRLVEKLIEIGERDRKYGECEVHFYKNARVNDRVCTLIEVVHPTPRRNFLFYKARIYIDDQLNVPIHYEAQLWPKQPGGEAVLDEAFTYLQLKLNPGLSDADFDFHNPTYHFVGK